MNSIKKKLFFQIGALIIILVGLMLLANTLLLETYYTHTQKNKLIDYYNTINSLKTSDYEENLLKFVSIETTSNIDILITNDSGSILYTSNGYIANEKMLNKLMIDWNIKDKDSIEHNVNNKNFNPAPDNLNNRPPKPPIKIIKTEMINDKVGFIWAEDYFFNNKNLMLSGTLDDGNFIEMRLPIASIKKNIRLSNDFLLIIGVIVFFIAMIFAYIVSNYFTKPIREMNDATKRMKNLDFKTFCAIESNDELGQLGESINEMSIELSHTIDSLNEKNRQLENEIKEKNRLDEKRRTLLNNVSHELKTPLSLMQGYAEGLKLNINKNKNRVDFYCDVIIDESVKMNQLVENLLNINEMEFGDKTLNKTHFEINDFVFQNTNKFKKVFDDKNIKLKINPIQPTEVIADVFMMERVFTNYLTNAINYVDENLRIEIGLEKLSNSVRIEVFNTAEQINETEIQNIWDSFYKLDKARTREKSGHGLGLSIVKAIQEAHNNSYGVQNVDNGVCFWFEISLA